MSRLAQPQLSFADLELQNQAVHLDPLYRAFSLSCTTRPAGRASVPGSGARAEASNSGRDGTNPGANLASLILMRIQNWDYRELRERIHDGHTLRALTDSNF